MDSIEEFLRANASNHKSLEDFFEQLKQEDKSRFREIIERLKQEENLDIWNYWHYKLKLNTDKPNTPQDASKNLIKRIENFTIRHLLFASILSFIAGSISWAVVRNNESIRGGIDFSLIACTFVFTTILTTFSIYRDLKGFLKSMPMFGLYILYLLLGNLVIKGGDIGDFFMLTILPISFIFLGLILSLQSDSPIKNVTNNFHAYLKRFIEIFIYTNVLSIPIFITWGIFIALLNLAKANISGDVIGWLTTCLIYASLITAIYFGLDPKQKFAWQKPTTILNLLSGFGVILTFITVGFLSIYILILIPSGFSEILKSGNTTITFISICLIIFQSIYLSSLRLEDGSLSSRTKINLIASYFELLYFEVRNGIDLEEFLEK